MYPSSVNVFEGAFHHAKDPGNFGRKSNGKVRLGFFRQEYAGSPLEMVLRFQFEYPDRITEFLVPSTALLSLTRSHRSIMADIGSTQSSSCYQCSVCSYTKTDLSHATINAFCFGNDWYVCIAFIYVVLTSLG